MQDSLEGIVFMSVTVDLNDKSLNPRFVAYNLVFGPATNGLVDITAKGLSDAMIDRGFDFSAGEAAELFHEWCNLGKLHWLDGEYVITC